MNYKAVEVIWIFGADTRTDPHTDGQTDRGVPRGPRGPKNIAHVGSNLYFVRTVKRTDRGVPRSPRGTKNMPYLFSLFCTLSFSLS